MSKKQMRKKEKTQNTLTTETRLYFGLPFDLWDQSHRCSEHTYGIDPKGALRAPMGSIPLVLQEHLGDQLHRSSGHTYGIDPIGVLRTPMVVILIGDFKNKMSPISALNTPI